MKPLDEMTPEEIRAEAEQSRKVIARLKMRVDRLRRSVAHAYRTPALCDEDRTAIAGLMRRK